MAGGMIWTREGVLGIRRVNSSASAWLNKMILSQRSAAQAIRGNLTCENGLWASTTTFACGPQQELSGIPTVLKSIK